MAATIAPSVVPEMSTTRRRWLQRVAQLGLEPHPEGGWYRRLYRADAQVHPNDERSSRHALSAILYLLPSGEYSRWHRLRSDEVWTYIEGSALELRSFEARTGKCTTQRLHRTTLPLAGIPAGHWQAARSLGTYTLVSCAVGPAFEFSDFELLHNHPETQTALATRRPEWLDAL